MWCFRIFLGGNYGALFMDKHGFDYRKYLQEAKVHVAHLKERVSHE